MVYGIYLDLKVVPMSFLSGPMYVLCRYSDPLGKMEAPGGYFGDAVQNKICCTCSSWREA